MLHLSDNETIVTVAEHTRLDRKRAMCPTRCVDLRVNPLVFRTSIEGTLMMQFEQQQTEDTDTTDGIRETLYLFWSWAWLIVLAGLLAGGVALIISLRTVPIY